MSEYTPDVIEIDNNVYSYRDYTLLSNQENLYLQDENYIHQTGNYCATVSAINLLKLYGYTNKRIFERLQAIIENPTNYRAGRLGFNPATRMKYNKIKQNTDIINIKSVA